MWTSSFAADMTRTRIRVLATPDVSPRQLDASLVAATSPATPGAGPHNTELMDVALGYTILSPSKYFWERYRETVQEAAEAVVGKDRG